MPHPGACREAQTRGHQARALIDAVEAATEHARYMRIVAIEPTPRRALPGRWSGGRSPAGSGIGATWFAVALLLGGGTLSAQQSANDFAAWLGAQDAAGLHRGLDAALSKLPAAAMRDAFVAIAGTFAGPAWGSLTEQQHRELMDALAVRLVTQSPAFRAWFGAKAAESSVLRSRFDLALSDLDRVAENLLDAAQTKESRAVLRVDCLLGLERLAEAEQESARQLGSHASAITHVALLNQAAQIQLLLGRFERARARLRDANNKLEEPAARDHPDWAQRRLEWLLVQFDLSLASGDDESLLQALAECRRVLATPGRPRDANAARVETTIPAAFAVAATLRTENNPSLGPAPVADLRAALHPQLEPKVALIVRSHLARLLLRQGDIAAAEQEIERLAPASTDDLRSHHVDVLASMCARAKRAPRTTLEALEIRLLADLDQLMARWREVPVDSEGTGYLAIGRRLLLLGELIELSTLLHGAERAFHHMLRVQGCTSLSRSRSAPTLDLNVLRRNLLAPGSGALIYVLAWGSSYLFAVGHEPNEFLMLRLPAAGVLRSLARDLRRELDGLCQDESSDLEPLRTASRRAREALLPPELWPLLGNWRRITVVGGTGIEGLPFEALELADGRLLGEAFAVDNTESLPLQLLLRTDAAAVDSTRPVRVRSFTNLDPAPEFVAKGLSSAGGRLGSDWQRLAATMPENRQSLEAGAATREAFLSSCRAGPWDLTVLLAHGRAPSLDLPAALGLSPSGSGDSGTLSCDDILSERQSGVVLLAACHGTLGSARIGDDGTASSLAGAFLHTGARAVVGSDYPLRLSLHEGISAEVAEHLSDDLDLAEAVRRSRANWSAGRPQRTYLASLIRVHGDGTARVRMTGQSGWRAPQLIAASAILALMLAGGLLARRTRCWAPAAPKQGAAGQC